jgi:hypothetical protein
VKVFRSIIVVVAVACYCISTSHGDELERPGAPHLLPAETLAYVRIANVPELVEKFRETAMGRIVADPQVQPFVGDLYRSAAEAFRVIEDRVGVPLHELRANCASRSLPPSRDLLSRSPSSMSAIISLPPSN